MKKMTLAMMIIVSSAAHAQTAETKPGLWESRLIHQIVDGKDISAQMAAAQAKTDAAMAKMTPEQRQQMASIMKGMSTPSANGGMQICISPAMAAKHALQADPNGRCPATSHATNGNETTYSFNCAKDGRTTTGSGKSTVNGNVITSHLETTSSDASGNHSVVIDSEMTYLGPDCKGITPIDQLAKGLEGSSK
jgi:hypothetical protein